VAAEKGGELLVRSLARLGGVAWSVAAVKVRGFALLIASTAGIPTIEAPTHDATTFRSLRLACARCSVVPHSASLQVRERSQSPLSAARQRMAKMSLSERRGAGMGRD
jgi:hypothetical protein